MSTPKWLKLEPALRRGLMNPLVAVDAVLESSLSATQKLLVLAIVSHWSKTAPRPSPGIRRLAALCSAHPETVGENIDALERAGLLRVVDRRHRKAHVYDLDGLMRGLLAFPPKGRSGRNGDTATGRNEDTDVDRIGDTATGVDLTGSENETDRIEGSKLTGSETPKEPFSERNHSEGTIQKPAAQSAAVVSPESLAIVREHYLTAFERKRGVPHLAMQPADERALTKILERCGDDAKRATACIDDWFAGFQGGSCTVRDMAKSPDKFAGAVRVAKKRALSDRTAPVQRTTSGLTGFENCKPYVPTFTPKKTGVTSG